MNFISVIRSSPQLLIPCLYQMRPPEWCRTEVSTKPLVTMDEEFKVREELCESYEVSADAKEYTWKLRKGVKFHNGEEMKADDVVHP